MFGKKIGRCVIVVSLHMTSRRISSEMSAVSVRTHFLKSSTVFGGTFWGSSGLHTKRNQVPTEIGWTRGPWNIAVSIVQNFRKPLPHDVLEKCVQYSTLLYPAGKGFKYQSGTLRVRKEKKRLTHPIDVLCSPSLHHVRPRRKRVS